MRTRKYQLALSLAFVSMLVGPGIIQFGLDRAAGRKSPLLDVMSGWPNAERLRRFEQRVTEDNWVVRRTRPWMQTAQWLLLRDLGENVVVGCDRWLFYRPSFDYVTRQADDRVPDAASAILDFRDQLATRGIALVVVPVPNKESVYPDQLTARAAAGSLCQSASTADLLRRLQDAGLDVVDLFALYARARREALPAAAPTLYLRQDSHWSPTGMRLAAEAVAERLLARGEVGAATTSYTTRRVTTLRPGDLVEMLRVEVIARQIGPEQVECEQVVERDDGAPYTDDPQAPVLVLGDSFLRIYQLDEPGGAGFVAHLALALQQPVMSLVNDGGASTLVRQELHRRPALLANKRVVVWEFAERDVRFGTEGWQSVPLPPQEGTADD
ncbi:MAG: hypothetical protein MUF48_07695 [Pirellulaceae bacterium]|jgi:hypothetical protein|nr:hypothetical protein [Pirellulaceae bacterium]